MHKPSLTNKKKSEILVIIGVIAMSLSISLSLDHVNLGNAIYFFIHVISVILGTFLSVVGIITYSEFKTRRLFLVACAFVAVTVAEATSIANFIAPFTEYNIGLHAMITHSLIALMLLFFVVGIFRSD